MTDQISWCQCEHICHPPDQDPTDSTHPAHHVYGASAEDIQPVRSIYGTFHICAACREDHPFPAGMTHE